MTALVANEGHEQDAWQVVQHVTDQFAKCRLRGMLQ